MYKVIKNSTMGDITLFESEDYDEVLNKAIQIAMNQTGNPAFHQEIPTALENRGYYLCGWSDVLIKIIEE